LQVFETIWTGVVVFVRGGLLKTYVLDPLVSGVLYLIAPERGPALQRTTLTRGLVAV
jgi:hypothetical protein